MFLHHHLLPYKTRHVGYAQKNVQLFITCMNFSHFICLLEENNFISICLGSFNVKLNEVICFRNIYEVDLSFHCRQTWCKMKTQFENCSLLIRCNLRLRLNGCGLVIAAQR